MQINVGVLVLWLACSAVFLFFCLELSVIKTKKLHMSFDSMTEFVLFQCLWNYVLKKKKIEQVWRTLNVNTWRHYGKSLQILNLKYERGEKKSTFRYLRSNNLGACSNFLPERLGSFEFDSFIVVRINIF